MSLLKLKSRGIGRLELLSWLNEFLETDYAKIEHLADGIAYCQVFDALYPGKIMLSQVNFHAQQPDEYEKNYQVLRRAFQACNIRKDLPVKKLVKGVFQEHFEFLHWVQDYVQHVYPEAQVSYRGFERRQQVAKQKTKTNSPTKQPSVAFGRTVNNNLIPRGSNSAKRFRQLMNPTTAWSGQDRADEIATGDHITEEQEQEQEPRDIEPAPTIATHSDPTRIKPNHLVRHSFQMTLEAHKAITQLETWMTRMESEPTDQTHDKDKDLQARRRRKRQQQQHIDDTINYLSQVLQGELWGRLEDLKLLQQHVDALATQHTKSD